jgi:hypothetical protein
MLDQIEDLGLQPPDNTITSTVIENESIPIDNSSNLDDSEIKYIPPPRSAVSSGAKIDINFTPRLFPTPMRESKLAEEVSCTLL